MFRILTQNKMALINFDNCKALSIGLDNEKPIIVVDDMIIGYYNTIEETQQVVEWIIESMNTDTSNTLVMPQEEDIKTQEEEKDVKNAEND